MQVFEAVARTLTEGGVDHAFGVVGSGNFHVTNALVAAGARFVAARHEGGAATMADAFARMADRPAVLTVHQGCGLTNAMTGVAEAAKSRTPLLVLAGEATNRASNFFVDQTALARAVGAESVRIDSAETAVGDIRAALATAMSGRTVLVNLPLDVQDQPTGTEPTGRATAPSRRDATPSDDDLAVLADAFAQSRRPVFVAGRGARRDGARVALERLAERTGALLATSAVAKGLFNGSPWALDVSGGFSSPLAAELIAGADLIVGWGCSLNMWTMRHGRLIGPDTTVVQVDHDATAIGRQRPGAIGVVGDVVHTAEMVLDLVADRSGYRSDALADRIAERIRWRDVPYEDESTAERLDPRTLSIALDDLLPAERVVAIDSGNFMGHPSMYWSVPDEDGFCFTQAYQSIGLGLPTAIGAALAQPGRVPVAALGDGGAMMSAAELDTVVRLRLPMVVVVYDDEAYGAEVHHFGPQGHPLDTVRFPDTDIAAIARGYGFEAVTARGVADLEAVQRWVEGPRDRPLLVDAKIISRPSWWLEEAFLGH